MIVGATNEPQKRTLDGLGDTMLYTQSSGQSTQSPTHSTTSHEQQVIQTNGDILKGEEDIFHVLSEIKRRNEELKLNTYT